MPELPEVETIVRHLKMQIIDRVINKVEILRPDQWKQNDPQKIQETLPGQQVLQVGRRAKFILIDLWSGCRLIIHLRMTGKLIWSPDKPEIDKFTRTILHFMDGSSLQFNDIRALGTIAFLSHEEKDHLIKDLGLEPLGEGWQFEELKSICHRSKLMMKDLLMDQKKIAGIGNIYANEILFRAGIHPERRANTLTEEEIQHLHHFVPNVLQAAIDKMGTSLGDKVSDYRSVYNVRGEYQNILTVYGREGRSCFRCGSLIVRIKQKQRSSYFCMSCQK